MTEVQESKNLVLDSEDDLTIPVTDYLQIIVELLTEINRKLPERNPWEQTEDGV